MSQTLTRPARRTTSAFTAALVVVVALWMGLTLPLMDHLRDPPRADVVVANGSVWDIGVELALADGSRAPLTTVGAERTITIQEVIAAGDVWHFRWTFRGREIARTDIADADLRAARSRVVVPSEVTATLRAEGAPPAP